VETGISWRNNRVLIVDDDESIHQDFETILKPFLTETSTDELAKAFGSEIDEGFLPEFEFIHARNGKEAFEIVRTSLEEDNPIAVAYIDIKMPPGWDGVETTRKIRKIDPDIEIVIMTAHTEQPLSEIIDGMESLHKLLYLKKPFEGRGEVIQAMTISLIEKWNMEKLLEEKNKQIELDGQRLEAVLDSTMDAIAMFDESGNLLFANRLYGRMFGLTQKELRNMAPDELRQEIGLYFQDPSQFEEAEAQLHENPEDTAPRPIEMRIPERRMLSQSMSPVRDIDENIMGHLVVYRDAAKEIEMSELAKIKDEYLLLRAEVIREEYSFDNIIGKSKKMREMYALMQQAIQSDITVLIRGGSGTGKELVAKSIHYNSSRKDKSFVAVNCAAIPETLIESELFGHERGSFTGAETRRIGKFEQADGGTILLDEIGEMNPALQARLLRVLQEREIQRVGGTATIPIDVRVIASTNKDLETAMKAGEFREDLFYRIAAFPITIVPLKERREDIPLLAEHFLGHATKRTGKPIAVISTEALQLLMNYDWPGNARQLENVIERAVLLETSGVLQPDSLPLEIHSARQQYQVVLSKGEEPTIAEILTLEEVEKQALMSALRITGNNIRQTARVLGINRATVYRKLEKFNLAEKE